MRKTNRVRLGLTGLRKIEEASEPALAHGEEFQTLARQEQPAFGPCIRASVSPDNRILVLSRERGLEMWDLATRQCVAAWPGGTCMAEFDRAGHLVVACDSGIYRWPRKDEQSGEGASSSPELLVRFGPPEQLTGVLDPTTLSAGQVGSLVAFADKAGWKSMQLDGPGKTVSLPTKHDPRKAAASGDGRHVAIAHWFAGGVAIWDAASGRHLIDLPVGKLGDLVFSPDGRLLASTPDGVRLWRTSDWRLASELHASGSTPNGLGIAFSHDSRALAVGQPKGILRLVDTQTGTDWARISFFDRSCPSVMAFTPDHTRMIAFSLDEQLPGCLLNLVPMRRELARRGLDWPAEVLLGDARLSQSSYTPMEVRVDDGALLLELDAVRAQAQATTQPTVP
jgi:WD40 repeat protein